MSEQPSRYQRSFAGLVGAIMVTLLAIGGFVAVRAFVRDDIEQEPEAVDYLETVGLAQDAGREIVYPASLPRHWIATSVDFRPGEETTWGVGILTRAGTFVGVRQDDDSLGDLLATYLEEDPDEITELPAERFEESVATQWQVFEDEGGDRAYAAEVGEDYVLVYGSAELLDLREIIDRLTTEPVA